MAINARNRPVFLDLHKIRLPAGAILSIGHRISGVLLVLAMPLMLYLLDRSVSGPGGFALTRDLVTGWPFRVLLFLALWALMHHLLGGVRHLLLDVGFGVEKPAYRRSALAALAGAPLLALLVTGMLS
jgi:succinate dehydrogenase / fumarate reductase cytochrome b subunit